MKTPKPSHTPSYIDESSLGVSMEDMPKRDPRVDPRPGDVLRGLGHSRARVEVIWRGEGDSPKCEVQLQFPRYRRTECLGYFRSAATFAEILTIAQDAPQ